MPPSNIRADRPAKPILWPEIPSPPGSMRETNEIIHTAIDDALVDHLVALTALDFAAADAAYQRLTAILTTHADIEDATALARFEALGNFKPGGRPELFEAEHSNIRRLLPKLRQRFDAFDPDAPDIRRRVVVSFEHYLLFRHVLDHHTRREQNAMYPRLENEIDPSEQREIQDKLMQAHEAALAGME